MRHRKTESLLSCPACGEQSVCTLDTRVSPEYGDGGTCRRRRRCETCNHRWTTFEIPYERLKEYELSRKMVSHVKTVISQIEFGDVIDFGKTDKKQLVGLLDAMSKDQVADWILNLQKQIEVCGEE